jgi:hypothetical protein
MFYRSIIYDSRSINVVRIMIVSEFEAYLTDDSRSIIYDHTMFMILALVQLKKALVFRMYVQ